MEQEELREKIIYRLSITDGSALKLLHLLETAIQSHDGRPDSLIDVEELLSQAGAVECVK